MESIISYLIESLLCGALFYLMFALLVSGKSSYNFQRTYLLISSICTLVFPLISIPVNSALTFSLALPEITIVGKGLAGANSENIAETGSFPIVEVVYFSILTIFLLVLIIQLLGILYTYVRGEKSRRGEIVVVSNKRISSPFSFFNIIFLRDEEDQLESECVITHEKAHVRRGHSFDIILISIINTIQWFNPFIYLIKKSLVSVHEYQADKDVIMSGYAIRYYQNLMLYSLFGVSPLVANRLNNSLTIKRLRKMENLNEKRNRAIMFVSVILMVSTLFFVVSCKTNKGTSEVISADTLKTTIQKADTVIQSVAKPIEEKTVNTLVVTGMKPIKKTTTKSAEKVSDATPPRLNEKLEEEEIPFTVVEVKPTFMEGDENTFTKWVFERLQYPEAAKNGGIQGRVILQFLVTETGKVTNVKVVRGVDLSLDQEAVRVVASSPDWTPGKQKGKNVAVRYTFPVIFQLR
ncbi:MAG: hypothetical protein A2X18_12085 [Bacteroidetes bacterium GWF2_40_14]|nr:MAG: hypothetical protein A2X18_12085 [Bacteroidetes bacterium GWF2_40_14]